MILEAILILTKSQIELIGLLKFWHSERLPKKFGTREALRCSHPQGGLTPSGVPF